MTAPPTCVTWSSPSGRQIEHLCEAELAELVTRDSMIGVANARTPVAA